MIQNLKWFVENWKTILSVLVLLGIVHTDSKHEAQSEWPQQVGQHLMDLLQTNNIQEQEITELRNQIQEIKNERNK